MNTQKKNLNPLLVIFFVVFIDLVGFGIVIPIMPYYAKQFGANATQLGFLMASYSLMQLIFSPIWGKLSDRIGRRPVILISLIGTGASLIVLGLAQSIIWLFIGRIFSGICGANISTATAYIADITTPENRAKGMGVIGASFGLGFIFGPAIGGVLSRFGYGMPMYFAACLTIINTILAFIILKEPIASIESRELNRSKKYDLKSLKTSVFSDIRTLSATLIFFIVTFAFTQVEVSFALFMLDRYQLGAEPSGWVMAMIGVIAAIIQGGLIGKLSKRFGEARLILVGTVLVGSGLMIASTINSFTFFLLGIVVVSIGNGFNNPSLASLASKGAPDGKRGLTMGFYQSAGSLARVLSPVLGGVLFDRIGSAAPFFCSSLIFYFAFIVFFNFSRKIIKLDREPSSFSLQSKPN